MIDPRTELLVDLDNSKSRVINVPGYIVICGGQISIQAGDECCSARNVFLTHLATHHPDLASRNLPPEDIKEWNHDGVYPDLLAFETDLAHLTGAVLLFVESPGSIAELGSFSCIPELASKLLVVVRESHYSDNSFIRLGPLKYLEDHYPKSIFVYDWQLDNSNFLDHTPNLVEALRGFIGTPDKTEAFFADAIRHRLLLIADLVDLFIALQESEIKDWLQEYFGIDLAFDQLRQYLFLLTKLGFVVKAPYGNNRFYIAPKNAQPKIEYATKTIGFRQERARLKSRILMYYEATDKPRVAAWKSALGKLEDASR